MDLGIAGRRAVLLGSSRGLGRACAESLAREGVHVVINGRGEADVEATAAELAATHGVETAGVTGDSTLPEVHDALLEACPEPDIVLSLQSDLVVLGTADAIAAFERSED